MNNNYLMLLNSGIQTEFNRNIKVGPTTNNGGYYALNRKLTRNLTLGSTENQREIHKTKMTFDSSVRTRQLILFNNVYNK